MKIKLDKSEHAIEKEMDYWKEISSADHASIKKLILRAKKSQPITLRMPKEDILKLKIEASREGLPYQTLIASVLHKYISGHLQDERTIRKAASIFK